MTIPRLPIALAVCALILAPITHAQEIVRIGFASPMTGPQAHYGQDNANGARMAVEELNSQQFRIRGQVVRFELVVEDDQADPRTGTIAAQRLVDSGIRGEPSRQVRSDLEEIPGVRTSDPRLRPLHRAGRRRHGNDLDRHGGRGRALPL